MNQEYYIQIMGRDAGPFTLEEVYQMIRQGSVTKQTIIRVENLVQPAGQYPELSLLLNTRDAPAPGTTCSPETNHAPTQAPWQLSAVMQTLWIYSWFAAILCFLSFICIVVAETAYDKISCTLAFPVGIAFITAARLSKEHPATALRITAWLFLWSIIDTALGVQFGSPLEEEVKVIVYCMEGSLYAPHIFLTIYYLWYKDVLPHNSYTD